MPRYEDRHESSTKRQRHRSRDRSPDHHKSDRKRDYRSSRSPAGRHSSHKRRDSRSPERRRERSRSIERYKSSNSRNSRRSRTPERNRMDDERRRERRRRESRSVDRTRRERSRSYEHRSNTDTHHSKTHNHNRREKEYSRIDNYHKRSNGSGDIDEKEEEEEPLPEVKPNFETTGALLKDSQAVNGIVLKYKEPIEKAVPKKKWRLYPFKNGEPLEHLEINAKSCFLFGRDHRVCDIPIDHPSCSSQHAVIQYRLIQLLNDDGITKRKVVRPFIYDLQSSNGTKVNGNKIEPNTYVELHEKDSVQFALSTRDYILLHQNSAE